MSVYVYFLLKYDVSVSLSKLGFHGGGICFLSSAFQSIPAKNGWHLTSSASRAPEPSRSAGSRTSSLEMRFCAAGENKFYVKPRSKAHRKLQLRVENVVEHVLPVLIIKRRLRVKEQRPRPTNPAIIS